MELDKTKDLKRWFIDVTLPNCECDHLFWPNAENDNGCSILDGRGEENYQCSMERCPIRSHKTN